MSDGRSIVRVLDRALPAALLAGLLLTAAASGSSNVAEVRDPTRPLRAPAAAASGDPAAEQSLPVLQSVLIGPERRHAVIDGQRISEGEARRGVKVLEIRPDGVVVSVDGAPRMTLKISDGRMHKEKR